MDIELKITEEYKNFRVDNLVSKSFDMISRSLAASLVKNGEILVSDRKVKPGYKVKLGEIITGSVENNVEKDLLPEKIDLNILFEDNYIVVINKQPGLIVHPGAGNYSGTLVNALLYHYPEILNVGDDKSRAGIVHRLDKNTSGIIVAAKTRRSLEFLKKEFKQRRVKKKYFALVKGVIKDDMGRITLPIGRHPQKRVIMATKGENLRHAETIWNVKERYKDATLVEALLKTGRTHQIRVHFYEIGYPLIGEQVYQFRRFRKKKTSIPRQMLHSAFLSFRHPYSGERISFNAPLPEDFKIVMDTLSS
ncbi:MAG: RluA family pseudouridine synthase [Desulfobacteraceae bacterium]|nr:RluA family pseudouridine synthase [Desulfobacteraceae bacterium]